MIAKEIWRKKGQSIALSLNRLSKNLSLDRSSFFPLSNLPLLLLDGGQAAMLLRSRSQEHVTRGYWRIAPSDSAFELEAKVREENNFPF